MVVGSSPSLPGNDDDDEQVMSDKPFVELFQFMELETFALTGLTSSKVTNYIIHSGFGL
jgi:hypothetical protein